MKNIFVTRYSWKQVTKNVSATPAMFRRQEMMEEVFGVGKPYDNEERWWKMF
jgi:hypothetical protein